MNDEEEAVLADVRCEATKLFFVRATRGQSKPLVTIQAADITKIVVRWCRCQSGAQEPSWSRSTKTGRMDFQQSKFARKARQAVLMTNVQGEPWRFVAAIAPGVTAGASVSSQARRALTLRRTFWTQLQVQDRVEKASFESVVWLFGLMILMSCCRDSKRSAVLLTSVQE